MGKSANRLLICCAAVGLGIMPVSGAEVGWQPITFQSTRLGIPLNTKAGSARAGKLCLPNSTLLISDFVGSEREFGALVEQAFASLYNDHDLVHSPEQSFQLSVSLQAIDAKLCARDWGVFGMGDQRSLSGQVNFVFEWSATRGTLASTVRRESVQLEVSPQNSKRVGELLPQALNSFARTVFGALAQEKASGS